MQMTCCCAVLWFIRVHSNETVLGYVKRGLCVDKHTLRFCLLENYVLAVVSMLCCGMLDPV